MNNPENQDKNWSKLMKAVFPPYQHPNPEAFVTRVMAQLENEPTPGFQFFSFGWKIPTFGLAALVAAFIFIPQTNNAALSTEALLLENAEEGINRMAFQNETPQEDELLTFALEER